MNNIRRIKDHFKMNFQIFDEQNDLYYNPAPKFEKFITIKMSATEDVIKKFWLVFNSKNLEKIHTCDKSKKCSYATKKTSNYRRHLEHCTDQQTFVEKQVIL